MIQRISIEGLALIDGLAIDLVPGFNVITGETGAGKSILIRAVHFLMGARAGAEIVRAGHDTARVHGEFSVPKDHPAVARLEKLGIDVEVAGGTAAVLLRRQLTVRNNQTAKASQWINDVPVTLAALRDVGGTLLDVFVQHESQRLLDPAQHTGYVDLFLPDRAVLEPVRGAYAACRADVEQIEELVRRLSRGAADRDYLAFRLELFEKFGPSVEDFQSSESTSRRGKAASKLVEALGRAQEAVDGGEGQAPLADRVREAARSLRAAAALVSETAYESLADRVDAIVEDVEDVSYEIGRAVGAVEGLGDDLEAAEERVFGYQELFRKFQVRDAGSLVAEGDRLKRELEELSDGEAALEERLGALLRDTERLVAASSALSAVRKKAADSIVRRVETELSALAMASARLSIRWAEGRGSLLLGSCPVDSPNVLQKWDAATTLLAGQSMEGAERAEFLLAANTGEPAHALAKVASGGEMSRILLSLKKALVADAETCVLVFDEIDTGISGRVADVVGRKLRELAEHVQVVCISHLPQVAVYADAHFLVRKSEHSDRTATAIVRLDEKESLEEIARLLSGAEVDASSLENARALKERAREKPKAPVVPKRTVRRRPEVSV